MDKLDSAIDEIIAVMRRHDITGFIAVHAAEKSTDGNIMEGTCRHALHLEANYSAIRIIDNGLVFQGKKQHHASAEERNLKVSATLNMASLLAHTLTQSAASVTALSEEFDRQFGAEHTPVKKGS